MIEKAIFANLIFNEQYARKTLPFLKTEYFQSRTDQALFKIIDKYVQEYNNFPTKTALAVEVSDYPDLNDNEEQTLQQFVDQF